MVDGTCAPSGLEYFWQIEVGMRTFQLFTCVGIVLVACIATPFLRGAARSTPSSLEPSARRTPTVQLIDGCLPAVVAIRSVKQIGAPQSGAAQVAISLGSGSVIHPDGFILTNSHVVQNMLRGAVQFSNGKVYPYRIVARFPSDDIAILKVDPEEPLPVLPLGRSDDLMLGEPTLVLGTPGGLNHSASTGIVSGLNRAAFSSNGAALTWLVQTSAAVSGGSSGGPMINAYGAQIGVIAAKKDDAENVGFAIVIDRVREILPKMIAAEDRFGFSVGLEVDVLGPTAKVTKVVDESPANQAQIFPGDIIRRVGTTKIRHGVDFHLALVDREPGQTLEFEIERAGKHQTVNVALTKLPFTPPVTADTQPGLQVTAYQGRWDKLPIFDQLKPVGQGIAGKPSAVVNLPSADNYALLFRGFIKIPADGLYTFYMSSDDGSRLKIGNKVVLDHDGLHGPGDMSGLARLKAGLHPIRLEYFESSGNESLQLDWEGPGLEKQEIPPSAYFSAAAPDAAGKATP